MEITGTIYKMFDEQRFSEKFSKKEIVIETQDQYPQKIIIEFVNNSIDHLDNFAEGMSVKIGINLRGREWVSPQGETKYFNSIQGWRIESLDQAPQQPYQKPSVPQTQNSSVDKSQTMEQNEIDDDEVPF